LSIQLSHYESAWSFSYAGITHSIYSTGAGPNVVILHELTGLIEECLELGLILSERVPARVHLPLLFGDAAPGLMGKAANVLRICVSREIYCFAANKTSPLVGWCRALCRKLKAESQAPGVAVVGMCLTGGFALTLVADDSVLAPVVAEPSLPILVHKAALGMAVTDAAAVKERVSRLGRNCVLGLRYERDTICPVERVRTIKDLIGSGFDYLELPGSKHSTLTVDRHSLALARTISFLSERLNTTTARSSEDPPMPRPQASP
jgi:dienelactone hydrolase